MNQNTPLIDYIKSLETQIERLSEENERLKNQQFDCFFVSAPSIKFDTFQQASQFAFEQTKDEPIFVFGAKKLGQTVIKKVTHFELERDENE